MRNITFCVVIIVFTLDVPVLNAQSESETEGTVEAVNTEIKDINDRIFFTFNQGLTASWLTRIIKQDERSNFVLKDFLPGLYFGTELRNIKYIVPMARLAVYYPLTQTFNGVQQLAAVPLHFGADMMIGARVEPFNWKYLRINMGPAIHLFFLNQERWNYFNLGAAAVFGLEVPLFRRWTLIIDSWASIDNGNLGTNSRMEPFDIVWQYQINIGFRYTKKKDNPATIYEFFAGLFKKKPKQEEEAALSEEEASLRIRR